MAGSNGPVHLVQAVYGLALGGSEMLAWKLASALQRTDRYDGHLYGVQESGPLSAVARADGLGVRVFSKHGRLDMALVARVATALRADKAQLVHSHHLGQLLYAGIAGRLIGAKVVHTEHEYYTLRSGKARRLLRGLSVLAHAVTSVAEPVTVFLRERVGIPGRKLYTIPNGVDVDRFQAATPLPRSALHLNQSDVVIGCLGRLRPEKGQGVLLEAFRTVHFHYPSTRLILIGDGPQEAALRESAARLRLTDVVGFLGARTDVPAILAACDIIALASVNEGLPMSILEGMASGRAVVATNVGSVAGIVHDHQTGLLVAPNDVCALTEALERLVKDPQLRQKVATHGLDLVRRQYAFSRTVDRYDALYEAVLNGRIEQRLCVELPESYR